MKRRVLFLTSLAAAGLMAAPVMARRHGPPPFMGDGAMRAIGAMMHGDDITSEQRTAMHERLEAGRDAVESSMEALREANEQLTGLLLAGEAPSDEALRGAAQRIAELRDQLLANQVETAVALRAVLSPEQLEAIDRSPPPEDFLIMTR